MSESLDFGSSSFSDGTGGDSTESTSPATTSAPEAVESSGPKDNPAWEPVFKQVPEMFHGPLRSEFTKWDANYNKLQSDYTAAQDRYKPYESYLGTSPQQLEYGQNLLNAVNTNPQEVYRLLQDHLKQQGIEIPGSQQQAPQADQNEQSLSEDPYMAELQRQQTDLAERQAQIDEYIGNQSYEREVDTYKGQLDGEINRLVQAVGPNAVDVEDLLGRITLQVERDGNFNVKAAYDQQIATFKRMYQMQSGGRPAPQVIPTNGTPVGNDAVDPKTMNFQQRAAYMKQLIDAQNASGG